ncbi:DUF4291 domain-containing protein [Clostridium sp. CX1]|uniref:DUF4291 domain-containing protein n=1 Tax=Clostridium tanneri TaxID=3037988 RepID=A0ABU4JY23_9CLOT|nr:MULTISPECIES: DUF4291 domain-containing protein [unclassified Clostridium]MCT8976982.1 DUF4291 domain-containing protein [Clostridium sp. CX1]MDW8803043.1 DUF4291 domain-containing protein [Clostridium sp. A1-XYC3]
MDKIYTIDTLCKDKKIFALYNKKTIRIYQAYNNKIADEALNLGKFGPVFNMERMTWIKPSFLWMMYRSGWATKVNQERILAIDILRDGFEYILSNAVLSTYNDCVYSSYEQWKNKLQFSEVRCQWDPDRDLHGNRMARKAIQLGIKGSMAKRYVNQWIVKIADITNEVYKLKMEINNINFDKSLLPKETEYQINDYVKRIIGM